MSGHGNYAIPPYSAQSDETTRRSHLNTTPSASRHITLSNGHLANNQSKHTSNYSYLPPPTRKSPKLPHKQVIPSGLEVDQGSNNKIVSSLSNTLPKNKFGSHLKTDV